MITYTLPHTLNFVVKRLKVHNFQEYSMLLLLTIVITCHTVELLNLFLLSKILHPLANTHPQLQRMARPDPAGSRREQIGRPWKGEI